MHDTRDYFVIVAFRSLDDLKKRMVSDCIDEEIIKKMRFDINDNGSSLFEFAIANRNYEIAHWLMDINTPVNIITKDGFNEMHIIAADIRNIDAVTIANWLLEQGVSLTQKDKKYGNTAMLTLAIEVLKRKTSENLDFIKKCADKKQGLFEKNKAGVCANDILIKLLQCGAIGDNM